jgi:hypothetical protein
MVRCGHPFKRETADSAAFESAAHPVVPGAVAPRLPIAAWADGKNRQLAQFDANAQLGKFPR